MGTYIRYVVDKVNTGLTSAHPIGMSYAMFRYLPDGSDVTRGSVGNSYRMGSFLQYGQSVGQRSTNNTALHVSSDHGRVSVVNWVGYIIGYVI